MSAGAATRAPERDRRFWGLLGLFILLLGLHLATPRLDSDQAVTGLMGRHILTGEFPIFFWGQHHAGVPESYGAAVTFSVFGISRLSLSLVPAAAALGLVLLLYRTGAVLFGRSAGLLAMLFATAVSPYVAAHYVRARAYYIEHLLVGQVVLLGAALLLARLPAGGGVPTTDPPEPLPPGGRRVFTEPGETRILVAMGLAGGLGLYFGFQIVDALVPAALAVLFVNPRVPLRRGAWLGLGAFFLGSAPFWIYNLTHDWATFATGARFRSGASATEIGRHVFGELLPVVLGMKEYIGEPPYLPWPAPLVIPAVAGGAILLLAVRVARDLPRLHRRPDLAGEAFLLVAAVVVVGAVWYGRFAQVPRYLVPLAPVLALILARAGQLVWRRARPLALVAAVLYLGAMGVGLVRDIALFWPASRQEYWTGRAEDEALFAFLHRRGLTRVYSFEYWLAPRLTFDARGEIIVAEPFNDRHPPYAQAVDASPRPAYIVRTDVERFEHWLRGIQSRSRRAQVGPYTVFWDFTAPPEVGSLPRSGWRVRTSPGRGKPESLVDGELASGWASDRGAPGAAWVEVDLGAPRLIAGLTLVTDRPQRVPQTLQVTADDGWAVPRPVARLETGGLTVAWRNGAPRTLTGRTLTVRFPPIQARRLRLTDLGPAGVWAVAELFALTPRAGSPAPLNPLLEEGRRLEREGTLGPALVRYREAMKAAPDAPDGYAEFARLAAEIGLRAGSPVEQAARYAQLGLAEEARAVYAGVAATLGSERTYVELAERRARLAAEAGDAAEARRLQSEAEAARAPRYRIGAVLGRVVELVGYDVTPSRAWPGETLDVAYHWRVLAPAAESLAAYVHFRGEQGQRTRFGDDHPLPPLVRGLGDVPQLVAEHRRVRVPADAEPGLYRLVAGVWDPVSGHRAQRWWRGLLPTLSSTVELGTIEIVRRP